VEAVVVELQDPRGVSGEVGQALGDVVGTWGGVPVGRRTSGRRTTSGQRKRSTNCERPWGVGAPVLPRCE